MTARGGRTAFACKHRRLHPIPIGAAVASFLCAPQAFAADERADALVKLFADACIPNMGNPSGVRTWAAQRRLGQISEAAPLNVFVGPGDRGAAWAVPLSAGNFALSIRGETQACAVWAQASSPEEVEAEFKLLVKGVQRPGLEVKVYKDVTTSTAAGRARELVYIVTAPHAPFSYVFTMLTAERANPAFQASLQVARASGN